MYRLLRRSPWLNPLRKRNNSNLDEIAKSFEKPKAKTNEYVSYVEKKYPRLVLSDKSIVLFECPLDKVFQRFRNKYLSVKLFCCTMPVLLVYYSIQEYERIEMYGTLDDWVKNSHRKNTEGWVKINQAWELFIRLSIISFIVYYILKERLLMRSSRFVTHCLFNYEEKALIFRTTDFRRRPLSKYLKVPVANVKWECKEGYAPPPTFFKQSEGSMYENGYGFSNVNITLPKYTEEPKPDKQSDKQSDDPEIIKNLQKRSEATHNINYRHFMLKLRGKSITEDRTEKFFIANGSQADETAFNEFITKMDLTGDPQLIIQQPDTQWYGLQNQTNLDGYNNKFANK